MTEIEDSSDPNRMSGCLEGTYISFDASSDAWMAVCPEHGVIAHRPGLALNHDVVVYLATLHEKDEHDADGLISLGMLVHLGSLAAGHG